MSAEFERSAALLDEARARGACLAFWWRDDDVRTPSAALERLLSLRSGADLPLALASIPAGTCPELAERLSGEGGITLLLHGHAHANHAPAPAKRAEFNDDRPVETMLGEIGQGRRHLEDLFGSAFLPIFVPPWNPIGTGLAGRLGEAGIRGLSTFARHRAGPLPQVNTHLDIMDWGAGRALDDESADERLAALLDARLAASLQGRPAEPIGLLTHHLQHDEAAWGLLGGLLRLLAPSPGISWLSAAQLFA